MTRSIDPKFSLGQGGNDGRPVSRTTPSADKRIRPAGAALHWNRVPSEDNNKILVGAFPGAQSFLVGSAVNVQFMVKDSKKYAATGGWGFGDFKDGKPGDEALHKACFGCHEPVKAHDFVFAHYAPSP